MSVTDKQQPEWVPVDTPAGRKWQLADDEPRPWYFTFGHGHRAYAARERFSPDPGKPKGFRLDDRYVVIEGTYETARRRMHEVFGPVWCAQYDSAESAGVVEYGLTELTVTADWTGREATP